MIMASLDTSAEQTPLSISIMTDRRQNNVGRVTFDTAVSGVRRIETVVQFDASRLRMRRRLSRARRQVEVEGK
jgi:hypothetical protein